MQVILDLFTELYEKQDILSKLTQSSSLQGYGYSVIHCLDAIGILDGPNITKIAEHLKMTRGELVKLSKMDYHFYPIMLIIKMIIFAIKMIKFG